MKTSFTSEELFNAIEEAVEKKLDPVEVVKEYCKDIETLIDRMHDLYTPLHMATGIVITVTVEMQGQKVMTASVGSDTFVKEVKKG